MRCVCENNRVDFWRKCVCENTNRTSVRHVLNRGIMRAGVMRGRTHRMVSINYTARGPCIFLACAVNDACNAICCPVSVGNVVQPTDAREGSKRGRQGSGGWLCCVYHTVNISTRRIAFESSFAMQW